MLRRSRILAGFLCLALALGSAQPAGAQSPRTDCVLGLYDDEAMTQTIGTPSGSSKAIYLGIKYDGVTPAQLTGIEFSISGLAPFDVVVEPRDDPAVVLGTPQTPAGIDSLYGQGGMNIAWAQCLPGERVLARLTLVPKTLWPSGGAALEVRRHYPPSNSALPYPLVVDCDEPYYTARGVRGGRYFLGIVGNPTCAVSGDTDFGQVPVGSSKDLRFTITNTGAGVLVGSVSAPCAYFGLIGADLSYALLRGEEKPFTLRFSPPQAGEYSCNVEGAGCGQFLFTGRTTPTVPIATLHLNPSFVGSEVTVEAQVYVPANYSGVEPEGWIQDGSGRGIQVHGAGADDPVLDSTSNFVRVTGTVARAGATLRLDPVRIVTFVTGNNPPLVPTSLLTHDAANPNWEGTFVQVTGGITSRRIGAMATRYVLDDNSGPVTVVVANALGLPMFVVGEVLTARGAGGYDGDYLVQVGSSSDAFLGGNPACLGRRVIVGDAAGGLGQQVDVPVRIQWNPNPIDAYGMRIAFDGTALRFVGSRCCGLTERWQTCVARAVGRDTLVLGGFDPTPIPANSTGDLICLRFEILACGGERRLEAFGLVDDLAGMGTCYGALSCSECLSDGDVNEDGVLTPQDAQCAFGIFLEGQGLPADCDAEGHCEITAADVNCDAVTTPGDAVAIFTRWLSGNAAPGHCFARPAAEASAFRCGAPAADPSGPGLIALPLEMRALEGPAAFALEIELDPSSEFVELRRAPAGERWQALAARRVAPDHVRVGGFDAAGVGAAGGWTPIATLVFRTQQPALALRRVTWRERIAGGWAPGPAESVTLVLGPPYPNPLRSGTVTLPLVVPAGTSYEVVAGVHDVAGRLVRRLRAGGALPAGATALYWDGTNDRGQRVAAGIYVARVQRGGTILERKLVVLQ